MTIESDVPATSGIPWETDWIEVYDRERLLSIPCARMPRYTATLAAGIGVEWFDGLASLKAAAAEIVPGRRLIVTLGDSNTASARAWPRRLARLPPDGGAFDAPVVINIANIAETAEQALHRLEALLAWPALDLAADVAVVYLGGVYNCARRLFALTDFINGGGTDFALESERQLAALPAGRSMSRLLTEVPVDEATFPRSIARRALAGVRALSDTATGAGRTFCAVLQPLCYADMVPSYGDALRRAYAAAGDERPFEVWRRERDTPYCLDVDEFLRAPLRPVLDALRARWASAEGDARSVFVDWSALFRDVDIGTYGASWYQASYDATHYSDLGWQLLAASVKILVQAPPG